MGRIAFVFSGQGDQFPGMGKDLYEKYPAAKNIFDLCEKLRPGTLFQCFYGTKEELKETENTQPCLFAMELAAAVVLMEQGIQPDAIAGFSLGEVTAAALSGLFDYEDGFKLVCRRGTLMQREAEKYKTSMAAVVGLSSLQVEKFCEKYSDIYAVNFNCPGQTVISGLSLQMPEFFAEVKSAGGRAIPLKVKGAFHSPFMKEAAVAFAEELSKVEFRTALTTLYSNQTANPYTKESKDLLAGQICNPVQWEKTVRNMIEEGIDTFIEIGPGHTLTNMMKKICPEVKAAGYLDYLKEAEAC